MDERSEIRPRRSGKKGRGGAGRRGCACGCSMPLIATGVLLLLYFLFPIRTTILILGIDAREPRSAMGRTDTNILLTIVPLRPTVAMVSIPRDLWVRLPGGEENRINTAHFFAESAQAGQGPYTQLWRPWSSTSVSISIISCASNLMGSRQWSMRWAGSISNYPDRSAGILQAHII